MLKLRKLSENYAMIHIPRLLALTIPFVIVTFSHMLHALGVGVPDILIEPTFDLMLIISGGLIAVLGMGPGFMMMMLMLLVMWGIWAYIYVNYVLNLV